jgi:hypothetical protein
VGTLTISDNALVRIGGGLAVESGSCVQLNGGYLALSGDRTASINSILTGIKVWNGASYVYAALSDIDYLFCSGADDDLGFTNNLYGNLDNYTIIALAVPEPSTYALFGGMGALSLALLRKRTRGIAEFRRPDAHGRSPSRIHG